MSDGPDLRAYLEIRTAAPSGFSPDGRRLLVSSNLSGTAQVHRLDLDRHRWPVDAAALVRLTDLPEPVGAAYLPRETSGTGADRLLLVTDQGGNERHQLFTAGDEPAGHARGPATSTDDLEPLVVDPERIHRPGGVSRDGRWLAYATNRGDGVAFDVWVRELPTGRERAVFATGGWASPGGFSPDGRFLAVSELTEQAGDNRVHLVDLHAAVRRPLAPGEPGVVELAPHGQAASVGTPSWLPDGSAFFFATDVGGDRTAIARGTPDGAWEIVLAPPGEAGGAVDWAGRHLLVVVNEDGRSRAELRDPVTLRLQWELRLPGAGVASGFRFSPDGRQLAYAFSSPLVPGDVWHVDTVTSVSTRLTRSPGGVDSGTFVDAEAVSFRSFDALEVPAFVFAPAGDGPFPVVVVLHGGPESQYRPSFAPLTQYLVASGFAVVAPNVRGSTGYGRRYQQLDDVERRFDVFGDLAALHDWLGSRPDLDAGRAALYGGSYGGYLVLAGLAFQPERWAAGVDVVGMSNLVTFLERTADWRRAFREREYGSLAGDRDLLERLSPINHVAAIRAPLFVVHGANDPRVPLGEAEQIHRVLGERGVPCELLVYPDEGHGLAKLTNRLDCYPRVVEFLRREIGQGGAEQARGAEDAGSG